MALFSRGPASGLCSLLRAGLWGSPISGRRSAAKPRLSISARRAQSFFLRSRLAQTKSEEVMQLIVETYHLPNRDFRNPQERQEADVDLLREFSEACREELHV